MPSPRALISALAALFVPAAGPAQLLDAPPPPTRLVLGVLGAARYNPLGLSVESTLALRKRLHASEELVLRDNFASAVLVARVSPASIRAGLIVELQPLTILRLWASAELLRLHGNFGFLQSFASANADTSEAAIDRFKDLGGASGGYAATGTELGAGITLLGRFGSFAVREAFALFRIDFPLRAGDRVFFDPYHAVVLQKAGALLENDLDAIYLGEQLTAGVRLSAARAAMGARAFAPGEPIGDPNSPQVRLGPLVAWKLFREEGRAVSQATVFLITQFWISHRYKTGAEISQAVPFVAAGISLWGDLLPLK